MDRVKNLDFKGILYNFYPVTKCFVVLEEIDVYSNERNYNDRVVFQNQHNIKNIRMEKSLTNHIEWKMLKLKSLDLSFFEVVNTFWVAKIR
jgi:hypothetical protein